MNCEKIRRIAKIGNGLASDASALAGSAGRVCLWTGIGIGVAGLVVVLIAKGNVRIEQARWRQRRGGEA
jgi:hypothetical protein